MAYACCGRWCPVHSSPLEFARVKDAWALWASYTDKGIHERDRESPPPLPVHETTTSRWAGMAKCPGSRTGSPAECASRSRVRGWAGGDGTAKLGEFMGWLLHQQGCKGFVLDSPCRDSEGLANIPDFSVFCDGITSIDSDTYWHAQQFNQVIGLSGQLVNQVRVAPGDWIIGGADGVIVVPQ